MANIPKAAMRATNNVMRGYIPHNGIVSAGAKIVAKNQSGSRTKSTAINQLHTINQLRPAMEQARNTMREKNRRESKNDIV